MSNCDCGSGYGSTPDLCAQPRRCTAIGTPDMIGTSVACDLDHDDGPRVHHEGQHPTVWYCRVTWMTGPYDATPEPTPFPRRDTSLMQERIDYEREQAWRR